VRGGKGRGGAKREGKRKGLERTPEFLFLATSL